MNNKKLIGGIAAMLCVAFFFSACNKNGRDGLGGEALEIAVQETSVPVSTAIVCGTMYNNVLPLITGNPLILKIRFKGENNLAQYKIDIHNNFDCHAHQKRTVAEWRYLTVKDISGKDVVITEAIPLPADAAAGDYHCIIRLIDEKGNEAPFVEFNLVVSSSEDGSAPVILCTLPATDSIAVHKGDILTFKGTVTDNLSLDNGKLEITYTDAGKNNYTAINEIFSGEGITGHHFERTYEIPPYITLGTAIFKLKAFDKYNNSSERLFKVYVSE